MKKLVRVRKGKAMTKKNLKENLDLAIASDYEDHALKYEAIKDARRALFNDMHESQQEAIKAICEASKALLQCYHEMYHPSFDDIVKFDGAFWQLLSAFEVVKDE